MSEQTPQLRILLHQHQHQHQHRHHNQPVAQPSPPSPSSALVETIYNVDDDTEPGQFLPDSPYSPVREHDNVYLSFQSDRKRVLDVFKEAIAKPLPSNTVALSAMQDAMKPQKQAVLVQDENQLLENGLRSLLQELVGTAVNAGEPVMHYGRLIDGTDDGRGLIMRLLDIVLHLCERGHVEGGMVFQLLEDLTEVSTIKDCKEVFGYIESKQELLGRSELFGRGKLVMLRTCNQLLRRLSKANDVVFCGRILMFLAHFFPLSERSAVNIKGVFNTSNETKYEKEPALDCLPIDINFYKTFWSLQEHFSSPAYLIQPARWQSFSSSLAVVLSAFEAQPLGEEDGSSTQGDDTSFNIKYLTSSNLLSLELKDPSFRRHVLVQCLIVFDYLKTPGKTEKDGPKEDMKEEATLLEERVKRLLEATPPKGKEFLGSIEHILKRERNWVWWKKDACPAFERAPEPKPSQGGGKKRKQRWRLGNKELSQLWKWADQNPNALTDTHRLKLPTVMEYWKPLAEDMDPSAGIEPDYHHKNNRVYCWKGLRLSARQDLEGFSKFTDLGFEGVVPPELLPQEVRHKIHGKASEKSKHKVAKKDDGGASAPPPEDSQANNGVTMLDDAANVQEEDGALLDSDAQLATKMGNEDGQDPDVDPDNDLATDMASPEENSPDRGASFENGSPPTDMVPMEIESHGILPQSSPRLTESNVRKHS